MSKSILFTALLGLFSGSTIAESINDLNPYLNPSLGSVSLGMDVRDVELILKKRLHFRFKGAAGNIAFIPEERTHVMDWGVVVFDERGRLKIIKGGALAKSPHDLSVIRNSYDAWESANGGVESYSYGLNPEDHVFFCARKSVIGFVSKVPDRDGGIAVGYADAPWMLLRWRNRISALKTGNIKEAEANVLACIKGPNR